MRSFIVAAAIAASLLAPPVSFARSSSRDMGDTVTRESSKEHEKLDKEYDELNKEIEESPAPRSWKDMNKQANEIFQREESGEIDN